MCVCVLVCVSVSLIVCLFVVLVDTMLSNPAVLDFAASSSFHSLWVEWIVVSFRFLCAFCFVGWPATWSGRGRGMQRVKVRVIHKSSSENKVWESAVAVGVAKIPHRRREEKIWFLFYSAVFGLLWFRRLTVLNALRFLSNSPLDSLSVRRAESIYRLLYN